MAGGEKRAALARSGSLASAVEVAQLEGNGLNFVAQNALRIATLPDAAESLYCRVIKSEV